jgi:hypothetical protein
MEIQPASGAARSGSATESGVLRAEVETLLARYFMALDGRDFASLRSCFAAGATAHYDRSLVGTAAILDHLREAMGRCSTSTHIAGSVVTTEDAESIHAQSSAVAFLVVHDAGETRIRVRGLRYRDRLVRQGGALVFQRRERVAGWTFEVAGHGLTGALP